MFQLTDLTSMKRVSAMTELALLILITSQTTFAQQNSTVSNDSEYRGALSVRLGVFVEGDGLQACALKMKLKHRSRHCTHPGWYAELVQLIYDAAGINIELVDLSNKPIRGYGQLQPDGNWSHMLGAMQRGEIDSNVNLLTIKPDRMRDFVFTNRIVGVTPTIVVPHRRVVIDVWPRISKCFKVYTVLVWFVFIGLLIGYRLVRRLTDRHFQRATSHTLVFMSVSSLCLFIVSCLYRTALLSNLVLPLDHSLFETPAELLNALRTGQITMAMNVNGATSGLIKNSEKGVDPTFLYQLKHALELNQPVALPASHLKFIQMVDSGVYAILTDNIVAANMVTGCCNCELLHQMDGVFPSNEDGLAFHKPLSPKTTEIYARVNREIIRLSGFSDQIMLRYVHQAVRHNCSVHHPSQIRTLTLWDHLLGAFAFLLAGCVCAGVVIVIEQLTNVLFSVEL